MDTSTDMPTFQSWQVKTGDRIDQDQVIAEIGSTGRSTGPHLHLEMFKDGRRFNPRKRLYSARKAKDH